MRTNVETDCAELEFAQLVAEHGPAVRGALRRVLGPSSFSSEADDLFQETFARLAVRMREPGEICVAAWLRRVAHNLAVDEIRRRRPIPVRNEDLDRVVINDPDADLAAAESSAELTSRLRQALGQLPDRQRVAVLGQLAEQPLRGSRLAGELGVSVDAAESILARARVNLRRHLAALAPQSEAGFARGRVARTVALLGAATSVFGRRARLLLSLLIAATGASATAVAVVHQIHPVAVAPVPAKHAAGRTASELGHVVQPSATPTGNATPARATVATTAGTVGAVASDAPVTPVSAGAPAHFSVPASSAARIRVGCATPLTVGGTPCLVSAPNLSSLQTISAATSALGGNVPVISGLSLP